MRTDKHTGTGRLVLAGRLAAAGLIAATLGLTAALPAQAAAPAGVVLADKATTLDAAKKLTTARIDGRLAVLRANGVAIRNAARLADGHQSALQAILDKDIAGLTELKTKVAGETTLEAIRADARSMVEDYRVYILVQKQVHLTVAADVETAAVARLRGAYDKLAKAIEAAKAGGTDTSAAEAKLADLKSQLDAAESAVGGVADALLAVQPGPDADAIKAKTQAAREKVHAARTALKAAIADAKAIKDLVGKKKK
ncbi:hypothetical protein Cs7R123_37000 [Catellatospora sp. TT07R-123]|uniref:hypothetical protein n=1 Tax=Catellatospora sp. TT07R-123 TaxID=2733863 RepID=UPI001B1F369A|nr:hypothetical protein [Catellatospora sp. TT07R-123]GHJ46358.1 hypothetical protein Cs7R123_37000 [Catellatospora sp. TT07R-123]